MLEGIEVLECEPEGRELSRIFDVETAIEPRLKLRVPRIFLGEVISGSAIRHSRHVRTAYTP
jgi:hypothetical protein